MEFYISPQSGQFYMINVLENQWLSVTSSIGNLTRPSCSNTNVMTLFPSLSRRKHSHGHRHYTPARLNKVSFDELLPLINEPLGLHHIRTKLYSIPLVSMHKLRDK